jgi:lauroyl/myristoyl acyltransferase
MRAMMESSNKGGRGTFMVLPHLTGFDLGGLLLASLGFKFLTLSYPNPPKGYEMQNKLRNDRGEEVMPMSFESTQLARARLQAGGTVLTGIDRPFPGMDYHPRFFGRPVELPVAYVKLALKTNARVHLIAVRPLPNMKYEIDASDEIPLVRYSDPKQELEENATAILKVAEAYIRENPESWAMFYPMWPGVTKD